MGIANKAAIQRLRKLLNSPRSCLEKEFSSYFYRYLGRYGNPIKFNGYVDLCKYLFSITKAEDASVLDLGCGFGMMATLFGLFGSEEVIGYDLNTEKIDLFGKLLSHLESGARNVKPILGDSSKIQYPDEYFDVVVANEVFSHVREMRESVKEVHRVLKIGGRFLLRDGNNSLFILGRIRRRRFWKMVELGPVDPTSFRSTDIPLPYFEVRKKMIHEKFPQMSLEEVNFLSRETAGMFGDEIDKAINEFEKSGMISKRPKFRYRNPMTGEFSEKELNPFTFKHTLEKEGFKVSFIPHFYSSSSFSDIEMAIKRLFYWMERSIPVGHLFLSPGFALLGIKGNHT
jgi:ubiquinone/menaquinone biosynthesis C-methylase UbiE